VFLGELPVVASPVVRYLEDGLEAAEEVADEDARELLRAVDRLLRHADSVRTMEVRANADTAEDAQRARRMGAQGIGLCRTEHMFLGERRVLVERAILAEDAQARAAALEALREPQRADFVALLEAMDGLPTTVACWTRRCTSSCPTAPTSWCRSRGPRSAGRSTRPTSGCSRR
jgi:pyruvate,orthophosphate dikinase